MSDQPPPYQPPQPGPEPDYQAYPPAGPPPPPGGGYSAPPPSYSSYPGYPSYPQAPGNPYGGGPQPKNHTTRNILLIVALVIVLFCGGIVALIAVGVSKAKDAIDDYDNYPGGPSQPITVTVGSAFTIHDMKYSEGWKLNPKADYDGVITGLTAVNDRPNKSSKSVSLDVKFLKGTTILAEVDCDSGATEIGYGQSKALTCTSSDTIPSGYDSITVNDSYGDYDY